MTEPGNGRGGLSGLVSSFFRRGDPAAGGLPFDAASHKPTQPEPENGGASQTAQSYARPKTIDWAVNPQDTVLDRGVEKGSKFWPEYVAEVKAISRAERESGIRSHFDVYMIVYSGETVPDQIPLVDRLPSSSGQSFVYGFNLRGHDEPGIGRLLGGLKYYKGQKHTLYFTGILKQTGRLGLAWKTARVLETALRHYNPSEAKEKA